MDFAIFDYLRDWFFEDLSVPQIEDAQLIFERSTEEPDLPNQFLLERNGRTVLLDADTMHSFAAGTVQDLVDHLYKAGYVDLCSQSDHA